MPVHIELRAGKVFGLALCSLAANGAQLRRNFHHLTSRWLVRVVISSGALLASAATLRATSYSYRVSESLPCLKPTCSGKVELDGIITVDQLGELGQSDILNWNLSIDSGSSTPAELTAGNSTFGIAGSPQIVAASNELDFTISQTGDGFTFKNDTTGAGWLYGAFDYPAQFLSYPADDGKTETGFELLTLPSTFTAESFGFIGTPRPLPTPTPEPPSLLLMLPAAALLVGAAKRGKNTGGNFSGAQLQEELPTCSI